MVSRRDLLQEEVAAEAARTWEQLRVGAVLEGTVRSLRDFGAFVDLGGVDGMVHVSELAWSRVKHPQEVLAIGQRVRVQVLRVADKPDKDGRRQVALSLKALAEDPWSTLAARCPPGSALSGTVTRVEAYGAFVEIEPGIEGLVHISKMILDRRLNHARQAVSVGQTVDVTVVSVDPLERRLGLSMVERVREARDAEAAEDRREHDRILADQKASGSFGSFADLLAQARKK